VGLLARGKGCNKEEVGITSGISMYFVNPLDITCKIPIFVGTHGPSKIRDQKIVDFLAKLNCSLLTLVRKKIE
jgi:hypothetical protein